MAARALAVSPTDPPDDLLGEAVRVLRARGVVALPTETFYGLAADAMDAAAVERVNALKGKPEASPVLLLLADLGQAERVAGRLPPQFAVLAERFWPGPLTLVVPASAALPAAVSGGRGTVGFRVPGLPLPRRLAALLGGPITGVSANRHGRPPCRDAAGVERAFAGAVELILDGGPTAGDAPSTVLDLTGSVPQVLREGAIVRAALAPLLPGLR